MSAKSSSKQRRTVLSEEDYGQNLSSIIQRDYYPDLPDLERQVALQQKRDQGDFAGAVAIRRAARQLQQHEESLQEREQQQEEVAMISGLGGLREDPRPLHRETLTGFHARVTSEDNAEFEQVQEEEIQANREHRNRVYHLALTNGRAAAKKEEEEPSRNETATPFLLASDQFRAPAHQIHAKTTAPAENSLFFVPQPASSSLSSSEEAASLLQLMPPPPNKKSQQQEAIIPKSSLVEYIPKDRLEKKIEPSATRFPKQQLIVVRTQQHLEGSEVGSTTTTTEYCSSTDDNASTDLDAVSFTSLETERRQGLKRKRREQETLVRMTPLIAPGGGTGRGDNDSPITTWGTVGATPLRLSGVGEKDEHSPNSGIDQKTFRLPEQSKRDEAAEKAQRKLEERARKSRAASKPKKQQSLTPAALSLLSKTTERPLSARSGSAFASALRSSYTTTPQRPSAAASSTTTGRRRSGRHCHDHASNRTPSYVQNGAGRQSSSIDSKSPARQNVTDGLLHLPK